MVLDLSRVWVLAYPRIRIGASALELLLELSNVSWLLPTNVSPRPDSTSVSDANATFGSLRLDRWLCGDRNEDLLLTGDALLGRS